MTGASENLPATAPGLLSRGAGALFKAALCLFLTFFLTRADAFLFGRGLMELRPAVLFATGVAIFGGWSLVRGRGLAAIRRSAGVLLPFAVLCVVSLASFADSDAVLGADPWILFSDFFVFAFSVALAGLLLPAPSWRLFLLTALSVTALTVCIDAFLPGTMSLFEARASGLAENPNGAGLIAVVLATAVLAWDRQRIGRTDLIALLLCATTEFMSQSRGGLVSMGLLLFVYLRARIRPAALPRLALLALLPLLLWWTAAEGLIPVFQFDSGRREIFVSGQTFGDDTSDVGRFAAIDDSFALIEQRPLSGWGTGYSIWAMTVGPHNMYLARWVDHGLPGLLAYLWLLAAVARLGIRHRQSPLLMLAALAAVNGLVSHNLLEERTLWLVTGYAVASSVLLSGRGKEPAAAVPA